MLETIGRLQDDGPFFARLALELVERGDGVFVLDPDFRIVLVNETFERLSGISRDQVLGRVFWDVFPEAARPESKFWLEYRRAMRERVHVEFEEYYAPSGIWNALAVYPLRGGGIAVFFRDVTAQKRAEAALRAERDFSAAVLDTIASLVVVVDADGSIVRFNKACERATGYSAAEVLGRPVFDLVPDEDLAGVRDAFDRLRAGTFPTEHRNRWRMKNGSVRLLEWANTVITDEHEAVRFVIGTATDVTERERASEDLRDVAERFRTLADNIAQLAWMADEKGWVFWYNRRWFEYTGTTLAEMEGWGWRKVHHPEHVDRVVEKFSRHIANGETWEDTFPLRGKDGGYRWFLSRALPIRDGGGRVVRWFGTNTDVTEQREAEEALREADLRKNEFLAMLSHELRNPLAPISNSVFLLERLSPESVQAARARQVIRRQTEHLTRLVEDLLDVTRISRGKVHLQREVLDVRDLVRRTCEDHRALFEKHGIEMNLDFPIAPVWVDADATRISQVVGNLLHNANKFTPPHGKVTVRLRAHDGCAEISVRDTGVGIDGAQLTRMFQPFAQEDRGLSRAKGGLGLGLALSKGLVDLHGGTMVARSEGSDRGAEFLVALPLTTPAAEPTAPSPPIMRSGSRRRILLVDDNTDAARTLADILEILGHEVAIAPDGESGIARARELQPDFVICDVGLPDVDGYDVARTLRLDAGLRSTRLIALSGYGYPEDKQRAIEAGFEVHLTRPVPLDTLAALLG